MIIISVVCVNGSELLARCIVTEMILIITNPVAVFIGTVYVNGNGIIKTIIVVHTTDSFCLLPVICVLKINPCTVIGGLTTTIKQFIAVVIAVSIVSVYGRELLILYLIIDIIKIVLVISVVIMSIRLIDITYSQFYHDTTSSAIATITMAIVILIKIKLKPSITVFISTMFKATWLESDENNLFYVIPVMFMLYTTQIKIYPCTINSTLIALIVNKFIELFGGMTTKLFIAEMTKIIVYVNGKVLKPFIAIGINVAAVCVDGEELSLIHPTINKCGNSALWVIYVENKTKGVVHSATSISNVINVKPFIAVVKCYCMRKWYERISHINNTNSKLNFAVGKSNVTVVWCKW